MSVGQFIAWCDPDRLSAYMPDLGDVWFEEACFNQERLQLVLHMAFLEDLHCLFNEYDEANQER
jgi:hypothetical protein